MFQTLILSGDESSRKLAFILIDNPVDIASWWYATESSTEDHGLPFLTPAKEVHLAIYDMIKTEYRRGYTTPLNKLYETYHLE